MSPVQRAAAFDYLEAVLLQDEPKAASSGRILAAPGQIASTIASMADELIPALLCQAFQISDTMSRAKRRKAEEAMADDRGAQASVLIQMALREWADDDPTDAEAQDLALVLLGWLQVMAGAPPGDHEQVLLMLGSARHTIQGGTS
ncbi:hypothetical protein [Streptomyces viridochromogenes]|uniref:hypothetical protein n=1 Tax=Streptomyces viridochromogenes TaxID=1938 RepID=UPI000AFDD3B8|nr:hypothetical protein [Streptomyces viridochromogenes]